MWVIEKLLRFCYGYISKVWNSQYYKYPGIDGTVKFSASFPGFVRLIFPERCVIGERSVINAGAVIHAAGRVVIGKYAHIGHGLTVYSSNHNYKSANAIPYDDLDIASPVVIGDFVWIGANVSIVPGVSVGEGAVIALGAVVTRNVPVGAVVAGNPARIIGQRDMALYQRLKAQGRFA
ncbi:acyltransferase [Chromobacterium vaccinii]|uniref:acyltransferase n=1 Tax=Chromobacterium vaccinii TaxID=1108595 RepID=UPI000B10E22F|nr:acyltransferase [Chromobacterium vaccinii]